MVTARRPAASVYAAFTAAGVEWVRPPASYDYGRVGVFKDLYGNLWDLVQFAEGRPNVGA